MNGTPVAGSSMPALRIAVVGHTNTGKTSLMRTLMRDVEFGEVSDRPATTRHVEGAALLVEGRPLIELYDTPGLEDSIALLDHMESLRGDSRMDGVELIQKFLEGLEAHAGGRFTQEAKALRQVRNSDLALYVIDARDRVLGKHRDELRILAYCARPIVPVLNFVAGPQSQTAQWREHLARVNLHVVAEFDTVVFDARGEQRLFEKMRTLLDQHRETINALMTERRRQRERLIMASAQLIAELLIDVAGCVVVVPANGEPAARTALRAMQDRIRDREQQCSEQLLRLHRFRIEDCRAGELPLIDGRWGVDLFSPVALKQFGIRSGGGAAAGAIAGLSIDAMVGGMTLGAATALGAAIGATLGAGHMHGWRLLDRLRGRSELRCDDSTLRVLMARQEFLLDALLHRGHASVAPIHMNQQPASGSQSLSTPTALSRKRLPPQIDEARVDSSWSRLNPGQQFTSFAANAARRTAIERLADALAQRRLASP